MPNTYVALRTETVTGSPVSSVTLSLSGISGYTDLRLVIGGTTTVTGYAFTLGVNGDTGSNYSQTLVSGSGSAAQSARYSNANTTQTYIGGWVAGYDSAQPSTLLVDFMNYSNTTTNKTILYRSNSASRSTEAGVMLWRNTAAITSITIYAQSGSNIAVGSTFSLYGIANTGTPKATGGNIYSDNTYWYHIFTGSGAFVPSQALSCEYLVVAGGGGGGSNNTAGGGGGAGGYRSSITGELSGANSSPESALSLASGVSYSVTVGGGGAGGNSSAGTNGTASSIIGTSVSISSTGGGGGGYGNGVVGGSGGGGGGQTAAGTTGAAGTALQGRAGGNGLQTSVNYSAAGGGGASAIGSAGISQYGGAGGAGLTSSASGFPVVYAGGGGGGNTNDPSGPVSLAGGMGGLGGGGNGGRGSNTFGQTGSAGRTNTGGGGGGGASHTGVAVYAGGAGGSGIVIIRYAR